MLSTIEKDFIDEVKDYLLSVTDVNFYTKYNELKSLVVRFNETGISGSRLLNLLGYEFDEFIVNKGQEEVFMDISSRIANQCHPDQFIPLKEW